MTARPRPQHRRHADDRQPDLLAVDARRGADRRPELLHRQVPDPAVPALDLPGRRHPVRRPLGDPRGDQRDRDRLRPQPEHLLGRRARLDAVHARHLEDVRRRRQPGRQEGSRSTRSTRSSPPRATCAPPAASRTSRRAIFAYNHADWYVDSVLLRARVIGGLPSNLVGSLTGLTQGRFPVQAKATYADDISERDIKRLKGKGNKAVVVESGKDRRGIKIFSKAGAPVVAVNDGRILDRRHEQAPRPLHQAPGRLRQHVHVRAPEEGRQESTRRPRRRRSPRSRSSASWSSPSATPRRRRPPRTPRPPPRAPRRRRPSRKASPPVEQQGARRPAAPSPARPPSSACSPTRAGPNAADAGGAQQVFERTGEIDGSTTFEGYLNARLRPRSLAGASSSGSRRARTVVAGTILGRIGRTAETSAPHTLFEIRPAGRGAPRIDPKPILDGWKLLESTAIYRAAGKNPFFGARRRRPVDRPDPADEQGDAGPAGAQQPAHRDLRLRAPRRPDRARSTAACSRRSSSSPRRASSRPSPR